MKILMAQILFFLARFCQKRGWTIGQWFQSKGILTLAKIGSKRD